MLRTPTGLEHVREAPGALIRFVLGRPVTTSHAGTTRQASLAGWRGSCRARARTSDATTLIVERTDTPQGIAVGSGELTRLSSGQVMTFRAPRPALRVVAATGPLVLSFDTEAERDRAAAELLVETGLGPDGTSPPTA